MEVSAISKYREERDYPPRLYAEGASNLENKYINHYCRIGDLPTVRDTLGDEVWEQLKQSPLGIIAELSESNVVWFGKTVHYLLCRQLRVQKKEIWSIVHGHPIRFGLNEFHEITGLNIDPLPTARFEPEQYEGFWRDELNVQLGSGPTLDELWSALVVCSKWSAEKRKWLGLLFLQATALHALHPGSRLPFESAIRVFEDQAMMSYPWGRIAFEVLVQSIKTLSPTGHSYHVNGFVYALQAWAFESVNCFGERLGGAVNVDAGFPLLRWGGSRTSACLDTLLTAELETHGNKVMFQTELSSVYCLIRV